MDIKTQLDTIYELAHVAYWEIEPDGNILWSKNLYKFYHESEDYEGVGVDDFKSRVFPDDYDEFEKTVNEAIEEKKNFDLLVRLRRKHVYVWVNIRGKVLPDGSIIGCTQDVDEFKRESVDALLKLRTLEALIQGNGVTIEDLRRI